MFKQFLYSALKKILIWKKNIEKKNEKKILRKKRKIKKKHPEKGLVIYLLLCAVTYFTYFRTSKSVFSTYHHFRTGQLKPSALQPCYAYY